MKWKEMAVKIQWPGNKDFAFTVFDDTDLATLCNVKAVYSLLEECGLKTTKTVWVLPGKREGINPGATCEDKNYLAWLKRCQQAGVEISLHMATYHSSFRGETEEALNRFNDLFGDYPRSYANHTGCKEAMYWGDDRLTGINKLIYNLATSFKNRQKYRGHVENDSYFWGDLCKRHIQYVRNFTFPEINTLKMCPMMPYHDPNRPYVNSWFASSDGNVLSSFNHCICEENQDRLEEEGGLCIMYTHFASGFYKNKRIDGRFASLIRRLAKKNGWFAPVSDVLDYMANKNTVHVISPLQRFLLESRWLKYKISVRSTT